MISYHSDFIDTSSGALHPVYTLYSNSVVSSVHNYSVVWTPDSLTWYFDDTVVVTKTAIKVGYRSV